MPKTRADYSFRYYALLGDPPTYDGPAPLEAAARYLERVQEALRLNGRRPQADQAEIEARRGRSCGLATDQE
jgi:hypothetical protein